jgi:hypothetical protein
VERGATTCKWGGSAFMLAPNRADVYMCLSFYRYLSIQPWEILISAPLDLIWGRWGLKEFLHGGKASSWLWPLRCLAKPPTMHSHSMRIVEISGSWACQLLRFVETVVLHIYHWKGLLMLLVLFIWQGLKHWQIPFLDDNYRAITRSVRFLILINWISGVWGCTFLVYGGGAKGCGWCFGLP